MWCRVGRVSRGDRVRRVGRVVSCRLWESQRGPRWAPNEVLVANHILGNHISPCFSRPFYILEETENIS